MANSKYTHALKNRSKSGFTIVELLAVIVIIAILAAIVVVAYRGVSNQAVDASMKSDLKTAADELAADYHRNKRYPALATEINNGQGLKKSGDNVLTYTTTSYGYCVGVTNPSIQTKYFLKADTQKIEEGECPAGQLMITTIAGAITANGSTDGNGTAARFDYPMGIARDNAGNIYVADSNNHRIRKITPAGVVSTVAGSTQGYQEGIGTAARFNQPNGVAVDTAGNIYVSDTGNNRIRKIPANGGSTITLAGGGLAGYVEGTGTAARFSQPIGLTVDNAGNVYVADSNNHRIRKITPAGVTSPFIGSGAAGYLEGTGTAARLNSPRDITIDSAGNFYIADTGNNRIRKATSGGVTSFVAGSGTSAYTDGVGSAAQFRWAVAITVDGSGNAYVADIDYIRKIAPDGTVTTIGGVNVATENFQDGLSLEVRVVEPNGIAVAGDGTVYFSEFGGNRIRKIAP